MITVTQPRRSPRGDQRKRDPERTRERILDAAVAEFGEHGFAGARTSAIAARAGVNQQLISYYFDGKEGLYQALQRRWRASNALEPADQPLADVAAGFLRANAEQRSWARLLAWEGLADTSEDDAETRAYFEAMVAQLRERQEAGELDPELDPAYVQLMLFTMILAPTVLPQIARRMTGLPAGSPEFLAAYEEQLRRVIERLKP